MVDREASACLSMKKSRFTRQKSFKTKMLHNNVYFILLYFTIRARFENLPIFHLLGWEMASLIPQRLLRVIFIMIILHILIKYTNSIIELNFIIKWNLIKLYKSNFIINYRILFVMKPHRTLLWSQIDASSKSGNEKLSKDIF